MGDRETARVVELDAVFPPVKKRHAEVCLQVLHGPGDGGGGEVEFLRHTAQRPQLCEGGQLLELIEIHHDGILLTFQNMKSRLRYP